MVGRLLEREKGLVIDDFTPMGVALVVTSVWTYLTKDDYCKDEVGNKRFVYMATGYCF